MILFSNRMILSKDLVLQFEIEFFLVQLTFIAISLGFLFSIVYIFHFNEIFDKSIVLDRRSLLNFIKMEFIFFYSYLMNDVNVRHSCQVIKQIYQPTKYQNVFIVL